MNQVRVLNSYLSERLTYCLFLRLVGNMRQVQETVKNTPQLFGFGNKEGAVFLIIQQRQIC